MDDKDQARCERFAQVLRAWGSVPDFVAAYRELGGPGGSAASVYRYAKAQVVPPIDFLVSSAETLGIRRDWLLHGEGEQTEAEEVGRRWEETLEGMREIIDKYPSDPSFTGLMVSATARLMAADPTGAELSPHQFLALERFLRDLSDRPVSLLWPELDADEPEHPQAQAARLAALHALHLSIPGRRQGRPLAEILADYEEEGAER